MNVVDSSGWLEYLSNGKNAAIFAPPIQDSANLIVPVICLYEVFRRLAIQHGEEAALQGIGILYSGKVEDVTAEIALAAADVSLTHKLPMADSLILATAQAHQATLWTQDDHFEGLPHVEFIRKP